MAFYDDWNELVSAANKKALSILKKDVVPTAVEIVKDHIQTDIYDAYTPKPGAWVGGSTYSRRYVLKDNLETIDESNNTILITSMQPASPPIIEGYSFDDSTGGAFFKMLESGKTGIWKSGFPRPAITNAQDEIDKSIKSGELQKLIEAGIKREFES